MTASHLGYTPEVYQKMLQRQAEALYSRFLDTLRSLKDVTEPRSRQLFFDDLKECLQEANDLYDTGLLTHHAEVKVKIMLQRSFEEHKALLRHSASVLVPSTIRSFH